MSPYNTRLFKSMASASEDKHASTQADTNSTVYTILVASSDKLSVRYGENEKFTFEGKTFQFRYGDHFVQLQNVVHCLSMAASKKAIGMIVYYDTVVDDNTYMTAQYLHFITRITH